MDRIKHLYVRFTNWSGPVVLSTFLLLMRAVYGWGFFQAGKGKLTGLLHGEGPVSFFRELGIPFPTANAWLVSIVETVGGLLLLCGLGSRLASIVLLGTMVVALLTAHREATIGFLKDQEMMPLMRETPFWFTVTLLLVIALGAGMFSVDAILKRFVFGISNRRAMAPGFPVLPPAGGAAR